MNEIIQTIMKKQANDSSFNLKDYCELFDLNYGSIRVQLSRYRKSQKRSDKVNTNVNNDFVNNVNNHPTSSTRKSANYEEFLTYLKNNPDLPSSSYVLSRIDHNQRDASLAQWIFSLLKMMEEFE